MKFIFPVIAGLLLLTSCSKENFITSPDAIITTSADSIKFDTVFTQTGSLTQSFKIFNNNDGKILLNSIRLMGGSSSPFHLNINGMAANEARDITIESNDSIYVFVSVNINPGSSNLPFLVNDSIRIAFNGKEQFVQLQAFGQNAHFLQNAVITGSEVWTNDLPYVILGTLQVDTNAMLTIEPGTRVYLHGNAPVLVDGTLRINGTPSERVLFTGDRLDEYYRDLPASWPGIYFRNTSRDNVISGAMIKNAYQAIVVSDLSLNGNPRLIISQSIIENAYNVGLLLTSTDVNCDNSLFSNCGNNIVIKLGGNYVFRHCTAAAYSTYYMLHDKPVIRISDADVQNGSIVTADLSAVFLNCIFWGNSGIVNDEILTEKEGTGTYNVTLDHCLFKAMNDPGNTNLIATIRNIDPVFDSLDAENNYFDFHINNPLAPGIDQGTATGLTEDLDGNNRNVGLPDIGCYEKQ